MVVGKHNGSYWVYSCESETLKQIRSQVKLTLVENTLEETLWIINIVCAWM